MKKSLFVPFILMLVLGSCNQKETTMFTNGQTIPIAKSELRNKIKGGWAGQVLGCTYGGPTEFRFNGTMIQQYQPIPWNEGVVKWWYDNSPGLYDDVYMDLTFVQVFDRYGLDAPADSFAMAFATAEYMLWHANQAARYNILQGIMPPASGHWKNNPHADDIDYQIEADFAGIMSPGMVNTASEISDKIGHIMNYGDGWYGGVYVGAMYSLAFVSSDIEFIVKEGLKSIPAESEFYQCINTVIEAWEENPYDWTYAWWKVERDWSQDMGCPDGALSPFNIDAKVNAAYIVIGLLYGNGDFSETIDISTRCGQDSDCNPASAGGILGTAIGYDSIPVFWKKELLPVEDMYFKYTTISLNDAYEMSYKQAVENILRNGGSENGTEMILAYQVPVAVAFEKAFDGLFPQKKTQFWQSERELVSSKTIEFEGTGVVLSGDVQSDKEDYVAVCEIMVDGEKAATVNLPASFTTRTPDIYWRYDLQAGKHTMEIKWLNPDKNSKVILGSLLTYGPDPVKKAFE